MIHIPTSEQLKSALAKAPEVVRKYIFSKEFVDAFNNIRTTHKLHLDEADKLSAALHAIFLELVSFNEFPNLLQEVLEQNSDQYDVVLADVNNHIFAVFREKLLKSQKPGEGEGVRGVQTGLKQETPQVAVPTRQGANIETLEKEIVSFNEPVVTSTAIKKPVNKLEKSVQEKPTEFEVKKPPQEGGGGYVGGSDPYREPIE